VSTELQGEWCIQKLMKQSLSGRYRAMITVNTCQSYISHFLKNSFFDSVQKNRDFGQALVTNIMANDFILVKQKITGA